MKLIDVLNMISKGELEEGTIVIVGGRRYEYSHTSSGKHHDLFDCNGDTIFDNAYLTEVINAETEIIPPDHIGEVDKNEDAKYIDTGIDANEFKETYWKSLYVEQKLELLFNKSKFLEERMNELCGEK